jgi:SAM-dependent methyltransferase
MTAIEWKKKERNSWKTVLSSNNAFRKELNKPYSYGVLWTFLYRRNFKTITKLVGSIQQQKILDIGCGSGWFDEWIALEGGFPVGIDSSLVFLKISKRRAQQRKFEADFVCADGEHLPFRDNAFHCSIAYQALHHFPSPEVVIRDALRVSKSFILGDEPTKTPLPELLLEVFKRIASARVHVGEASGIAEIRFDPKQLEIKYKKSGYEVAYTRTWSFVPTVLTKLENVRIIREICKTGYFILANTKILKQFGHGLIMIIQKNTFNK